MKIITREKIKSGILVFLIIISIVKIGILWNYQFHEIPIKIFEKFSRYTDHILKIREFFRPDQILVSEGFDESHWILNKNSEEYKILWEDVKLYLKDILEANDSEEIMVFSDDIWSNLIIKKSIILEFRGNINRELLCAFFGGNTHFNLEPMNVKKVIIQPFDTVNNVLTIYITDKNNIYKYSQPIKEDRLSKNDYNKVIIKISEQNLRNYSLIEEVFPSREKAPFNISSDIVVTIDENKYEKYNTYFSMLPILLDNMTLNKNSDLGELVEEVLGKDKDYYDIGVDSVGTIVLKNLDNIYRIYRDGFLEYKYLSYVPENGSENIVTSFEKAVEFINSLKNLSTGAEITLTEASRNEGRTGGYTFKFDYKLDDIPVVINGYESEFIKEVSLNSAIEIVCTNHKVISCLWLLRDFEKIKENQEFNVGFENLLESLFENYEFIDKKSLYIENIHHAYIINSKNIEDVLKPGWMVKSSQDNYIIPLKEKGEESGLVKG